MSLSFFSVPLRSIQARFLLRPRVQTFSTQPLPPVIQENISSEVVFYDPKITLSRRQREVFSSMNKITPTPSFEDHGYLYGLKESDLVNSSDAVKRVLSTRVGSLVDLKQFRAAQIIEKVGGSPVNSGASRVQGG